MVPMILGRELWFGALQAIENEVVDRLRKSRSLFDALLLETYGHGHSRYRRYLDQCCPEIPDSLNPASDTHVAISGFLVARAETAQEAQTYAAILDCGLKKVVQKHPAAGMPGFANDWKLLLGAAMGTKGALERGLNGDWSSHRDFVLKAASDLGHSDLMTATIHSFIQKQLGEEGQSLLGGRKEAAGLRAGELICTYGRIRPDWRAVFLKLLAGMLCKKHSELPVWTSSPFTRFLFFLSCSRRDGRRVGLSAIATEWASSKPRFVTFCLVLKEI